MERTEWKGHKWSFRSVYKEIIRRKIRMKIYVNEQAGFGGDGTMEHPLQTIGEAAKLA